MAKITIKVSKGKYAGKEYEYTQKESLIVGREKNCHVRFSSEETKVSRRHCLIEIAPPLVMVRDFGSLNGTYLNGWKIGSREKGTSPEEGRMLPANQFELKSGDKVGLGTDCELTVYIREDIRVAPLTCVICGKQIMVNAAGPACEECAGNSPAVLERLLDGARYDIGNLRKVGSLGAGGMGEVWLVEDGSTRSRMALKVMLPKIAVNEANRLMFLREGMIGSQLAHKNVVRQHKFGRTDDGLYYILMEYCAGGSLDDLMEAERGRLDVATATGVMLDILEGLHYAHNADISVEYDDGTVCRVNGIVHRDLKPGNVFVSLTEDGAAAKVADFGLAKAFEISGQYGLTRTGSASGTPFFMPRKQIIDYKYAKPDVDVWAAAATYYYMLTGLPPKDFTGNDPYMDALSNAAVPILKRNPKIPSKLADVIDYALSEEPDIGVQSAKRLYKLIVDAVK